MYPLRSILSFLCGLFLVVSSIAAAPAPLPSADEVWEQLVRDGVVDYKYPDSYWTMTGREKSNWIEAKAYLIQARGLEFIQNYPADPRRWKIVSAMMSTSPRFIVGYGPKIETDWRDVVSNQDAKSAWREVLQGLLAQMRRASDMPEGLLESTLYSEALRAGSEAGLAAEAGRPVDWEKLFAQAESFAREFPNGRFAPYPLRSALTTFGRTHSTAEARGMFARYADHPNTDVAEFVRASLRAFDLATTPMELKFTAVDGREVDLAKLRGKVVLVDFWATWCGPCKEEIPHVKKVYATYRDKGFEIVGITLENARLQPDDTPEQRAEKLEKAKKKLTDFTTENAMTWPQSFDGKGWSADIPKQFAVSAIPAMFLLDREGKLVTTNASGEKLEADVRKLLGL